MELKIRIHNLERNNGSPRLFTSSFTKFLENGADDESQPDNATHGFSLTDYDEIDFADEYFDPEEEKSPHFRPFPEYVPSNSLPHSKRRFRHAKRVGLLRDFN